MKSILRLASESSLHLVCKPDIIMIMRDYEFYYTQDGSVGLFSYADDDVYHSKFGALSEAWEKFIIPSGIDKTLNTVPCIKVLDVCYGAGYNTKALMSYVINSDKKLLRCKNFFLKIKNFYTKFLKNLYKILKLIFKFIYNIVSRDTNNKSGIVEYLSASIVSIDNNILSLAYPSIPSDFLSKVQIDCLDIDENLVKISPLLKTGVTPESVLKKIEPNMFKHFKFVEKIKNSISKSERKSARINSRAITEKLNLKFNNDYGIIENEYRINNLVNYILIDRLIEKYDRAYYSRGLKKIIADRKNKKFFDRKLIRYALFKQRTGYKSSSENILLTILHNIYYGYLSKRYKNIKYKDIRSLFNVNFYVNDARNSILEINEQYNYIFLDSFTFSKAPELWSVEFISELYNKLAPNGLLMTYSTSALVRNTLIENNFYIGKIYNMKTKKCIGTIAAKNKFLIKYPLNEYETGLCATKAGIPYRDPGMNSDRDEILKRREAEFKESNLMSSSMYLKVRKTKKEEENNNEV